MAQRPAIRRSADFPPVEPAGPLHSWPPGAYGRVQPDLEAGLGSLEGDDGVTARHVTNHGSDQLSRADSKALLAFIADVHDISFDHPYPPELVARLGDLVPAAHVLYRVNDLRGRRTPRLTDAHGTYLDDADELYWTIGPCAITEYRRRTADLSAARLTDVVSWRRYRETAIYREYFSPRMVDHMLDLGLQAAAGWQRTILFCRERGDRDFSARDRALLEALRPQFRAREARADFYRRAMDTTERLEIGTRDGTDAELTPREREVVFLVAGGKTNAQIAAQLWVTPATVKKHLENVYAKLGVSSRAAAATIIGSSW